MFSRLRYQVKVDKNPQILSCATVAGSMDMRATFLQRSGTKFAPIQPQIFSCRKRKIFRNLREENILMSFDYQSSPLRFAIYHDLN